MGFLQDDHKGSLFQSDLWVGYPRHTFGERLTLFHMFKTFIRDSDVFFMSQWVLSEFRESEMGVCQFESLHQPGWPGTTSTIPQDPYLSSREDRCHLEIRPILHDELELQSDL